MNCSAHSYHAGNRHGRPNYNLGAHKLFNWFKSQPEEYGEVEYYDGDPGLWESRLDADVVALSVVFSWHAPLARDLALRYKAHSDIWAGGPGLFALSNWWRTQTDGLEVTTRGVDVRFEKQPAPGQSQSQDGQSDQSGQGQYRAVMASRGCPIGCSFCIVPKLEGRTFTMDWDFVPAPVLMDNNLSGLPFDFQQHIVRRYQESGVKLEDANSGFEPHSFSEEIYQLWKPILKGPWRFAFDEGKEAAEVERTMLILANESPTRKQVYCLAGNESVEECYRRALKIIELKGEPHCQFLLPLNWLGEGRGHQASVRLGNSEAGARLLPVF